MSFEEMILQRFDRLESEIWAMFILQLILAVGVATYVYDFKNRHTIQNLAKTAYQLSVREVKKIYRIRKNLGGETTRPDALPMLEQYVAKHWIDTNPRIMEFTESIWLPIIRNGNFTRFDWKPLTERWKSMGILAQKDPNAKTGKGTALVAAKGEIGMERKLALILSTSPAAAVSMPKTVEMTGNSEA